MFLTIGLPPDLIDCSHGGFTNHTEDFLTIESVDMNLFVDCCYSNQVHSWAIRNMIGIDCRLHQLFGQYVEHACWMMEKYREDLLNHSSLRGVDITDSMTKWKIVS